MLFNSLPFLILLIVTFFTYYIAYLRNFQVLILILSSFIFYAWNSPHLLLLLLTSIAINAATSFKISSVVKEERFKWAFIGVLFNLLILGVFKYGNLVTSLITQIFNIPNEGAAALFLSIPLPIGISFYTFEGISLLIDAAKRSRKLGVIIKARSTIYLKHHCSFAFSPI